MPENRMMCCREEVFASVLALRRAGYDARRAGDGFVVTHPERGAFAFTGPRLMPPDGAPADLWIRPAVYRRQALDALAQYFNPKGE
jgi:hypothetical protein